MNRAYRRLADLALGGRRRVDAEMDQEIEAHMEMRAADLVRAGMSPSDARAEAKRRFGDFAAARRRLHAAARRRATSVRQRDLLGSVRSDLRSTIRQARRAPGFTATIILTLALGVGVNSAMFTAVDRVFFRSPEGVSHPELVRRLVSFSRGQGNVVFPSDRFSTTDPVAFHGAVGLSAEFEGIDEESDQHIDGQPDSHTVAYVTTGFLHLVGVRPYRGRFFDAAENVYGSPRNVAVLNYDFWQHRFNGDSAILGRTMRIDSTLFTIIGIAPPRFEGMDVDVVDVWAPLASRPTAGGYEGPWWNGDYQVIRLFMRLAPGANLHAVEARLNAAYRDARQSQLERDPDTHLETDPLMQGRGSMRLGRADDRNLDLMTRLAGVALLVLVVATTNVASLLLMRALKRRREIAVRIALGISRNRLMAQLMTESALLALVGGAAALVVAAMTGGVIRAMLIKDVHWSATLIDVRVVGFTLLLAVVAGLAAGLAPATIAFRDDLSPTLKSGSPEAGRPRSRLRVGLLLSQTALCMLLLAAAGVFLQSLQRAGSLDLGFDAERLITFNMFRIDPAVVDVALTRVRALPGVAGVSRGNIDLRGGGMTPIRFPSGDSVTALLGPSVGTTDTAYARTLGLRLLRGRLLSPEDARSAAPVAVINEAMANGYWRGRDPIGECFRQFKPTEPCIRIVGVVGNVRWFLTQPPIKIFYRPTPTPLGRCCPSVAVRTRSLATPELVAQIHRLVSDLPGHDSQYPPTPRLVIDRLEPQFHPWRVAAAMFLLFGLLALTATGTGIYGLVAYDVTQRTHEFGVRMTLGASAGAILGLVVRSGLRVIVVGLVVGIVVALAAGRLIASLLFETQAYDPVALTITSVVVSFVAIAASVVPAWRATRVDPVVALRAE